MISLMQKIIAILLIVAIGTAHSGPCDSVITRAQYDSIQMGWTRSEVTKAIGSPGNLVSEERDFFTIRYVGVTEGSSADIFISQGYVFKKTQEGIC
jgi:hypothetical protein